MQSIYIALITDGFTANNPKTTILVFVLRDKKKKYILALTKSISIIREFVDKSLHPLLDDKSSAEI